jgi:hypothetical protein
MYAKVHRSFQLTSETYQMVDKAGHSRRYTGGAERPSGVRRPGRDCERETRIPNGANRTVGADAGRGRGRGGAESGRGARGAGARGAGRGGAGSGRGGSGAGVVEGADVQRQGEEEGGERGQR